MILSDLSLYQYRNISDTKLRFSTGLNLFIGKNGQGKTNLVEAIHLLSTTKSFRTSRSRELIGWEKDNASIFGTVEDVTGSFSAGIIFEKDKKKMLVNDTEEKASHFISKFVTITFSPSDIEIIKGDPIVRRQFLDKHCADAYPSIISNLLQYNRALKNKVILLRTGTTPENLEPWNHLLATHAAAITQVRKDFLKALTEYAEKQHTYFAGVDGALQVTLKKNISAIEGDSEEAIFHFFSTHAAKEIEAQKSLYGPHRDDIEITYGGVSGRKFSSQGQAKSLGLSLKLGLIDLIEQQRGEAPVIILDDVDSELDPERLKRLYGRIAEEKHQVFITGTEIKPMMKNDFNLFTVEGGVISSAKA